MSNAWAQDTAGEETQTRRLESIQDEIRERQAQTARALTAVGRMHLSEGRYEQAVASLTRAAQLEPESRALQLTLGTAQFRVARYRDARDTLLDYLVDDPDNVDALLLVALSRIELGDLDPAASDLVRISSIDGPLRSLALIQLGRVRDLQGDFDGAQTTLQSAIDSSPDEPTAQQARDLLDLVERRKRAARPYRIGVSVAGLYDDNVVTAEIDDTSGARDGAAEFELSGGYKHKFQDETSVELGYDLFQSVYGDSPSFNLQTHTLSFRGAKKFSEFDGAANYAFTRANLDDDRLFDSHQFATSLATFPTSSWYLLLSPRVTLKNFEDDDRDGQQASLDVTNFYFFPEQSGRVSLALGYDHENTNARRFDYHAFRSSVGLHIPVLDWFEFDARYKFRLRDYTSETPSISMHRLDKTHTATASVSRKLGHGFEVRASYEHEHADSNLDTAEYVQNHVRLQLRWDFE